MTTQTPVCIVHNRKYLSKFHGNINQLRRTNQYSLTTLQKLSKRYCSCHEQNGESSFDLNHLHKLCQQIESSQSSSSVLSVPEEAIHYVILEFPSTLNPIQRVYKAGRFVGRGGQHLRLLERKLNISINIVNRRTNKNFRQIVDQLKQQNKENVKDDLWVLITMKNKEDNIEEIKQSLQNEWKKIDVTIKKNRSQKVRFPRPTVLPSPDISGDTRWKPKKQNSRDKQKSKQKQCDEQKEIQPQPFVRPISMPKEIIKSQKNKRK